jgi:hypothetical protein
MRKLLLVAGIAIVLITFHFNSFAQLDGLFAPIDCREHAEFFHDETEVTELISIDSSLIVAEETAIVSNSPASWKEWAVVENFSFGKDRGSLTMITDLNALHPYFRDKVKELIIRCKKQGIELAIVETYRTHAKQNEYKTMGKKYTNSKGGKSKHQYGLAVDLVPIVNGAAIWDNVALWRKVGIQGEKLGLRWGGRWKKPYDPGHFEWTGGLTSIHLASGILPPVPEQNYPCVHEDIAALRIYWKQWEIFQEEALAKSREQVAGKPREKNNTF